MCPGTPDKPRHDCTLEAAGALEYMLRAPVDVIAVGVGKAEDVPPPPRRVAYEPLLELVQQKLGSGNTARPFRVQVKCQTCSAASIVSRDLLEHPQPDGTIQLLPPTPGDEALVDAAKGVSGVEALKAATANATFVLANLALLGTLVTTLGLAKTEEIASKLADQPAAYGLLAALAFGAAAIILALWAIRVGVREVHLTNLEEVRAALNDEVTRRARASKRSIVALGLAILSLGAAFAYITIDAWDDDETVGAMTVSPSPTLNFAIETSWSGAKKDWELQLAVRGAATLDAREDVAKGSAEIKTSVQAERGQSLTVTSKLVGDGVPSTAVKELCYSIPSSGSPAAQPCPGG